MKYVLLQTAELEGLDKTEQLSALKRPGTLLLCSEYIFNTSCYFQFTAKVVEICDLNYFV